MDDREAYVDRMLGIEHEPPTEEKRRAAGQQIARDRQQRWRLQGKIVRTPRLRRSGGAEKFLNDALGIDAQESLIHGLVKGRICRVAGRMRRDE